MFGRIWARWSMRWLPGCCSGIPCTAHNDIASTVVSHEQLSEAPSRDAFPRSCWSLRWPLGCGSGIPCMAHSDPSEQGL